MSAPLDEQALPRTPIETEVYVGADRRAAHRVDCHTVVTALAPGQFNENDVPSVYKAYSEDISVSGAKLVATEPLPSGRLYLHFLLPSFGDRYVQAEVVSHSRRDRRSLHGQTTPQYVYGVRFSGIVSAEEMHRALAPHEHQVAAATQERE